jgi:hypothetical protein
MRDERRQRRKTGEVIGEVVGMAIEDGRVRRMVNGARGD